jgi:hypothetical protein
MVDIFLFPDLDAVRQPPAVALQPSQFVGGGGFRIKAHEGIGSSAHENGHDRDDPWPGDSRRTNSDPTRRPVLKEEEGQKGHDRQEQRRQQDDPVAPGE